MIRKFLYAAIAVLAVSRTFGLVTTQPMRATAFGPRKGRDGARGQQRF